MPRPHVGHDGSSRRRGYARRSLVGLLLLVVLELSAHEFVEVRALSAEALRARFGLPRDCEPVITALSATTGTGRLLVLIDCHPTPLYPSHLPGP